MKLQEMIALMSDVKPYDKGTATMWTDHHISKYLLDAHINPDINMASRKADSIDKIIQFIQKYYPEQEEFWSSVVLTSNPPRLT